MSVTAAEPTSIRWTAAEDHAFDALALAQLAPLAGPFLPWTPYSMRAGAIVDLVSDIALRDRRLIVECGSGNSTIFMARLLRARGGSGRLVSIDHDAAWAELIGGALEAEGLASLVEMVVAPLEGGWYSRAALPALTEVGLLVVDGPTAYTEETRRSREPALDYFAPMLAADATIVLDDARRGGEQEVIAAWTQRHGREFELQPGGHAVSAAPWS